MVTSTIYSNQGTPDVYVDGVYVGKISNGSLTYSHLPYESDVTVTLSGCSSKAEVKTLQSISVVLSNMSNGGSNGTYSIDSLPSNLNITYTRSSYSYAHIREWVNLRYSGQVTSYEINESGSLLLESESLVINYTETNSSYNEEAEPYMYKYNQNTKGLPVYFYANNVENGASIVDPDANGSHDDDDYDSNYFIYTKNVPDGYYHVADINIYKSNGSITGTLMGTFSLQTSF